MGHKGIVFGGKIIPKRAPPSSDKGEIYQSIPDTVNPDVRSVPQIEAELHLGASAKYAAQQGVAGGKTRVGSRIINRLPVALGKVLTGADYGGMSYEERLAAHRAATDTTLLQLANVYASKSASSPFSDVEQVISRFADKRVVSALRELSGEQTVSGKH